MTTMQSDFRLRPFVPEDYDGWYELYATYNPEPPSPEQQRKRLAEWNPADPRYEVTAENATGEAIGFGRIMHRDHQAEGAFYLALDVAPKARGAGVGRAILADLERFGAEHVATILTAFVRDGDTRSLEFMAHHGFPLDRELFESKLDLTSLNWSDFEASRVENRPELTIRSWAELGDTPENRLQLYGCAARSDTAPDMDIWGIPSQEDFEKDTFGAAWYVPEGLLVAIMDNRFVGHHMSGPLEPGGPDWTTDYTGVIPEYRGKGIGMALKLKSAEVAIALGAKTTLTHNDSENKWMLAINDKLGFVRQPGWKQVRKRR